jgi:hypothetical protein
LDFLEDEFQILEDHSYSVALAAFFFRLS